MNIVTILNKLKAANMIANTEDSLALFSDCFNKFGISLLMLKDETKFSAIVDLLVENKIPLQKANGIYNLRIFAVDYDELKRMIKAFKDMGELDFLRQYPEMLAAPKNIKMIINNMKMISSSSYKKGNEYDIKVLLMDLENIAPEKPEPSPKKSISINEYLKTIMQNKSIVDKVENNEVNNEEEDFNSALELQKVENKICEEYLFPINDEWKIIIDKKEINTYQTIKETINKLSQLNLSLNYNDALIFVLFYNSPLAVEDIDKIVKTHFLGGD